VPDLRCGQCFMEWIGFLQAFDHLGIRGRDDLATALFVWVRPFVRMVVCAGFLWRSLLAG
jgi:hypothetical protein